MTKRSVIVTNAASPVGAAIARRFGAEGDRLLLVDRDETAVCGLVETLEAKGVEAAAAIADISNKLHVHNVVAEALETRGRIDVLAHVGFAVETAPFLDLQDEEFDSVLATNARAAFLIAQAVCRQMIRQIDEENTAKFPGAIVNVTAAPVSTGAAVAFAAAQGGVREMTRALSLAVAPHGIRVNALAIGALTGMTSDSAIVDALRKLAPGRRLGDPEEAAEAAFFLASPAASYICGQSLTVDGGGVESFPAFNPDAGGEGGKK